MLDDDRTWVDGPTWTEPSGTFPDVAPYVIEASIGQGGMSTVYRARAPDGATVALKVLHDLSDKGRVRFEREAAVRIEHKNIVRVFDAGRTRNALPFIALELLDGETLAERGRREPLDLEGVVDVGLQGARGLAEVHAAGLVHRDVKPSNLFCCSDGTLKILDFGVARCDDAAALTTPGAAVGTPKYMSPEQARGEAEVGPTSDVWSLGAVLYEALAGVAPFDRGAPIPTLLAAARGVFTPLAEIAPHVPSPLAGIVERAVATDVTARFASAQVLHAALAEVGRAEVTRTERLTPTGVSIDVGQERIVAVLVASFVEDAERLAAAIAARGGEYHALAGRCGIGLFGADTSYGDEVQRAVDSAMDARSAAGAIGVASGRATRGAEHIRGEALDRAVEGARLALPGVAIDVESARSLDAARSLVRVAPRHLEISRSRSTATPSRGRLAPLVGRAETLGALASAIEDDATKAVLVTGIAGVGKTRLCEEAIASAARAGTDVLRHEASSHRAHDAYAWFADALRARFEARAMVARWPRLGPAVPLVQRRRAVRRFVAEVVADEERQGAVAACVASLFSVPADEWDPETPELRQEDDRLRAGLFDFFDHLTQRGPLLLFVDRADWVDASSMRLLRGLAEQLADRPLTIVMAARDPVEGFHGVSELPLDAMPRASALALARRFSQAALTDDQLDAVVDRAEGNPAFIEQLVRVSKEQGAADQTLPLSVEAAVQARIDRVAPSLRTLTAHLALIGRPFEAHEARSVVPGASDAALDALVSHDVLRAGPPFAFTSALVAEVATRSMTEAVRSALHRRMAEVFQRYAGADPFEVATHLEAAGGAAEAAPWFGRAAHRAARSGDSNKVLRAAERAVASGLTDGLVELHLLVAQAHRFLGDAVAQAEALEAASVQAGSAHDHARVSSERALWWSRKRRSDEALQHGQRAIDYARASGDGALLLLAQGRQSYFLVQAGRLDAAEQLLVQVEARGAEASVTLRALTSGWRGQLEAARANHAAARAAFARAAEQYREAGDLRLAASAQANLADLDNRLQDPRSAAMNLRRAAAECRRVGNRLMEGYALVNLGHALTTLEHHPAAQAAFRDAALILRLTPDPRLSIYLRLYRARGVLAAGRAQGVGATAEQIAKEADKRGLDTPVAHARALAARVALVESRLQDALDHAAAAVALVEAGRVDEDEAAIALVHVEALEALGRGDDAKAAARRAVERIEAMGARIEDEGVRRRFVEAAAHRALRGRG
ncbi:MAG: serine/threonine-protein kinase [Deltaproteobacteria bacterium]